MKKDKLDSWSSIVTKDKSFIARKTMGYSAFAHGTVVSQRYQEPFLKNLSNELTKGTSIPIKLIVDDIEYDSKIDNPNSKGRNDDLVRLMFGREFKEVISQKLKVSYNYIMANKDPNSKAQVLLPAEYEEYMDFYIGPEKDTFIVKLIARNNGALDNDLIEIKEMDILEDNECYDSIIIDNEKEVADMIQLPDPADDNIDVKLLESIFNNLSNSDKICWFNSMIEEIMIGNTTIPLKNIVIGMISENWDIILTYNLNLGKYDKFNKIIPQIKAKYLQNKNFNKDDIYNELKSLDDDEFNKIICTFYDVSYEFLKPFFKEELKSIKSDNEKNKKIEELTIDNPHAIYEINSCDKYIQIHENWIKYIYDNEVILKMWIREKKKEFLISKNKDRAELIEKIFSKADENINKNSAKENPLEMIYSENTEKTLNKICDYIKKQGFTYPSSLIKNLYLALKTKPFVILSGISGTGKSKLIQLFAEAVGANSENKFFNLVPVKPEWSDSSDLLGFRNLEGKFVPGIITTCVKRAIDNPNVPVFICLDEMNLARVEYYFADILSIMESRKYKGDKIISDYLLNENIFGDDNKAKALYGNLYFPDNLYIIGTVNMDETTFPFSKKVLDRSFVIEFNEVDLNYSFDDLFDDDYVKENKIYHNDFLKSEFIKIAQCKEYKDIAVNVISELIKINTILEKYNSHFGYRVRDEIVFYVIYAVRENLMSFEEAIDICVFQKILPKFSGSSSEVMDILLDLFEICADYKAQNRQYLEDEIDKMYYVADTSLKYKLTNKKLLYMIRRYEHDSFTSFYM